MNAHYEKPGADDEQFTPALNMGTHWRPAVWDRGNPYMKICVACGGNGVATHRGKQGGCLHCGGRGWKAGKPATQANAIDPALIEFLKGAEWSDFAQSLYSQFVRKGTLSPKQVSSASSMMEKCRQRDEERKAREEHPEPTGFGDVIDLSDIPSGYYAVPNGKTRLKVRIKRPGPNSRWHGWIFVDDGAAYGSQQCYGKQAPGKTYAGKIIDALLAIKADPAAASKAYGHLVGRCGVCGRLLEDETSVANGIGPICAGKMGW